MKIFKTIYNLFTLEDERLIDKIDRYYKLLEKETDPVMRKAYLETIRDLEIQWREFS